MARTPEVPPQDGEASRTGRFASREVLELWMVLARREWGSLVIVPADPEGSTAHIAKSLAEVGQRLSFVPVTSIAVNALEYGSALALADLQQHMERDRRLRRRRQAVEVNPPPPPPDGAPPASALVMAPSRLIISIPPVVQDPLGLAATQEADAVVISIEVGRSRVANVRRTMELVGRERIAGCVLVR